MDRSLYQFLAERAPAWKVLPDIRIPFLLVTLVLCILFGRDWTRVIECSAAVNALRLVAGVCFCWLTGSMVAVFLLRVWTPVL